MQIDQNAKWRYFGRVNPASGKVYEVHRCPDNGKHVEDQEIDDVHLLLRDGSWRPKQREVLMKEILRGDFDDKGDQITEEEALNLYQSWQADWPGRT